MFADCAALELFDVATRSRKLSILGRISGRCGGCAVESYTLGAAVGMPAVVFDLFRIVGTVNGAVDDAECRSGDRLGKLISVCVRSLSSS